MLAGLLEKLRVKIDDLIDPDIIERIERLDTRLNEYGVDPWGFDPDYIKYALPIAVSIYRNYFRVQTTGLANVPRGKVLLIGNHSGQIPIDGMLIVLSMFIEADPPRMVRSMVETWSATLPLFSFFFPRTGQIVGTRDNCRRLLERDEAILAFPEGTRGISKTFANRYQLQNFGLGFMRLALMTDTPIVPIAVVGAEEQIPSLLDFKPVARLLGFPAFPVTPTFPWLGPLGLLPLPVKYHIYFGKPMHFSGDPDDEDEALEPKVQRVRRTIQRMLRDGLKARKNVFW
ncbi:MAG TPA: lysophospholipid acyltransferase family protein [Myxococcota bacterium]|nr:lysophospholipid acyltransferase family protein [Myxococcota bacterium]